MLRTYQQIQATFAHKGYRFFEDGSYNPNLVLERTSNIITNKFDDFIHLAYKDENLQPTVLTIQGNTKPGINTGVISMVVPGQYLHAYQFISHDKGVHPYPFNGEYFALRTNLNIWLGRVDKIDFSRQVITTPDFGTDIHKQSPAGKGGSTVGAWSLACSGAIEPEYNKLLPVIYKAVATKGNIFSATWINSSDFI